MKCSAQARRSFSAEATYKSLSLDHLQSGAGLDELFLRMLVVSLLLGQRSDGRPAKDERSQSPARRAAAPTAFTYLALAVSFSRSFSAASLAFFSLLSMPFTRSSS